MKQTGEETKREEAGRWKKLALDYGFSDGALMSTDELVFCPEYLQYCQENTCGNYGKNPACPPLCGTVEELRKKVMRYPYAFVLQSTSPCDDFSDTLLIKQLKLAHNQLTMQVRSALPDQGRETEVISAGPFLAEKKRYSCLSAYCIDAAQMAQSCNMTFYAGLNQVSFYSIILTLG
ncbi:MAG: DUF2284 domain-containing protein [Lachnospiraceae bacterium]|nr:DUF2284 domain-containing protein [Lachnospiraceae bacterium]